MRPEESPEAKYDRLKQKIQDSILTEYPNPERKGCPGSSVLEGVAFGFSDERVESDSNWQHITHCSECYREFLEFRRKLKRVAKKRRTIFRATMGAVVMLAAVAGLFFVSRNHGSLGPQRPQNAEVAYHKIPIDIATMERSDTTQRASSPILLDAGPDELIVNLPVGSKAGQYEVQLLENQRPVISAHADAAIRDGTTAFAVKVDLSKIPPGSYTMYVRQVPWDWTHFPVVVR